MRAERIQIWWHAARPRTLPAAAAPVLVGTAMAVSAGRFHALAAACALSGALLIQIGANLANDYFDHVKGADTPGRIGPMRVTQAGLISPRAMQWAIALVFALACVPGLYIVWRGGGPFIAVGLASIASGLLYTGGPYPLGYLGLGDLFVLIFFGLIAVAGTFYVQALSLPLEVIIAGLGPGLLSVAILTVNNVRDIEEDRKSGKKTLAVRWGRGFGRAEYLFCIVAGSCAVPAYLCWRAQGHWEALAAGLTLLAAIPTLRTVLTQTSGPALNNALGATGKLLLLYSLLFAAGWMV